MTAENENKEENRTSNEAWEEVGRQFRTLGESVAAAFRAAWEDEHTRQHFGQVQAGLEEMVDEIGKAVKEKSSRPEMQQLREDAKKAAADLVEKGEQTVQEVRPHLLEALKQVNQELSQMIEKMEKDRPSGGEES